MKNYPIENLLRKPFEWWSVVVSLILGIALIHNANRWLIPSHIAMATVAGLALLSIMRFFQGRYIMRYQRNLRRLPYYAMSSDELPISDKKLFLGRGFQWQAKHTQRLLELKQRKGEGHLKPGRFYQWARALELKHEHSNSFKKLIALTSSQNPWNPVRPLPAVGGNPAIHGIELHEKDIYLNLSERVGHTMILGTTRVGKTRLLELMISSDIRRNDSAVIVLDPKGDVDLLKRLCHEAKQAGRADDVIVFHLGHPKHSARYNPIGNFARITEVANRVANQLPGSGESAAFKEFAWRFVNILANALAALGRRPTYRDLDRYLLNSDALLLDYCEHWLTPINPCWKTVVLEKAKRVDESKLPLHLKARDKFIVALINHVDSLKLDNAIYDGLRAMFYYDQTYFQKITASLSPLFAKLTSGSIAELISPDYADMDDERPMFDWLQVIRGKKIVYVGLDALSDSTVSSAVGNSMFADLCSTVGQIYKFGVQDDIANLNAPKTFFPVNVYSDEFNELAGDEFIPLANKGGGAGLQLTVATQTGSDVLARLGSQAKANQVFGNFNTLICFRILEANTAQLFLDKLPQRVQVSQLLEATSVNESEGGHFSSHNEDRLVTSDVPLLSVEDLTQSPKGQAFCSLDGSRVYHVRFPLPKADMVNMPDSVEGIIEWLLITENTSCNENP